MEAGPRFSLDPTEGGPAQYCVDEIPHGKSLMHPVV
jgi:hypothetical protein